MPFTELHETQWGGRPTGKLMEMIEKDFGSFENFEKEFKTAGATAFGSGWAWLVHTPSGLKVTKTIGADCPLTEEGSALFLPWMYGNMLIT